MVVVPLQDFLVGHHILLIDLESQIGCHKISLYLSKVSILWAGR